MHLSLPYFFLALACRRISSNSPCYGIQKSVLQNPCVRIQKQLLARTASNQCNIIVFHQLDFLIFIISYFPMEEPCLRRNPCYGQALLTVDGVTLGMEKPLRQRNAPIYTGKFTNPIVRPISLLLSRRVSKSSLEKQLPPFS